MTSALETSSKLKPSSPKEFHFTDTFLNAKNSAELAAALQENNGAHVNQKTAPGVTWTEEERRALASSFCVAGASNERLEVAVKRAVYDVICHAVLPTPWTMMRDKSGRPCFYDKHTDRWMQSYPLEETLRQLTSVIRTGLQLATVERERFFGMVREQWARDLDSTVSQWHPVQQQGNGRAFYYNKVTMETTSDHPFKVVVPEFYMKLTSLERFTKPGYLEEIWDVEQTVSSDAELIAKDAFKKGGRSLEPLTFSAPIQSGFKDATSTAGDCSMALGPTGQPPASGAPAGIRGSRSLPALVLTQEGKARPSSGSYTEQTRPSSKGDQSLRASKNSLTFCSTPSATAPSISASENHSEQKVIPESLEERDRSRTSWDKGPFTSSESSASAKFQSSLPLSSLIGQSARQAEQREFLNRAKFKISAGLEDFKMSREAWRRSWNKSAQPVQGMSSLPPISSHAQATATAANIVTPANIPNVWQQSGAINRDVPVAVRPASSSSNRPVPVKPLTAGSRVSVPPVGSAAAASSSPQIVMSAWVKDGTGQPEEKLRGSVEVETVADIVKRLRARLDGRQLVCVIGSAPIYAESVDILRTLATELASRLRLKAVFGTAGQPGLPKAFAEGLIAEDGSQVRLWHVLPVAEESCCEVFAKHEVRAGADAAQHKEIFGQLGDLYIIAEGGPEDADIARAAHARGATIVPLAVTGGASSGLYGFPKAAFECPHWALELKEAWGHITNSRSRLKASYLASAGADVVEGCLAAMLVGPTQRPRSQQSVRTAQWPFSAPSAGGGNSSSTSIAPSRTKLSVEDEDDVDKYLQSSNNYRNNLDDIFKELTTAEARLKEALAMGGKHESRQASL